MLRWLAPLLLCCASLASAQATSPPTTTPDALAPIPEAPAASPATVTVPAPIVRLPAPPPMPMPLATPGYYPAGDYITAGQDEPGYRAWIAADPNRPAYVRSFNAYLVNAGVGGVAPTWQLLRTASQWQRCGAQPFEIPPTDGWPNIVAALRYIGAFVMPRIGPVEPVSVYRNPSLNRCAGGATESTHRTVGAIDMVPLHLTSREALMVALCQLHLDSGTWNNVGLGLYKGVRFHIDAKKFREWGTQGARGDWGCGAVIAEGAMPYVAAPATAATGSSELTPITMRPLLPLTPRPQDQTPRPQ